MTVNGNNLLASYSGDDGNDLTLTLVFVDCQLGQEEGKMKGSTKSRKMDEPFKCRDDTRRLGYVLFESGATGA